MNTQMAKISELSDAALPWFPAFAGMTGWVGINENWYKISPYHND